MASKNKQTGKTAGLKAVMSTTSNSTPTNKAVKPPVVVKRASAGATPQSASKLTDNEITARKMSKIATTSNGFFKTAYSSGDVSSSSGGNFYSPQLSTDFLEKPQNLRERRAWYRHFYNANEFVGSAIDLHSTIPISKIRLAKPKCKNEDMAEYVYDFFTDMCDRMKLFQTLIEVSHEYWLLGNCFMFAEEHDPYALGLNNPEAQKEVETRKQKAEQKSNKLLEDFGVTDKDPNYMGWDKIMILPPDQVRIQKVPFSDKPLIEYVPDPATRDLILNGGGNTDMFENLAESQKPKIPTPIVEAVENGGAIPLDSDPHSGSHCFHLARKKSQYETYGTSILERCVNTLLLNDKLRQAQTSIASRHMTPIRVVWAEELSTYDVEDLRSQVDMALMDPDFSIIANYQINWEEFGVDNRLLELSSEYEHHENSLFAGLGVTREMLTGEGSYGGSRVNLEILNQQYLLFRELLQDYVEENLFKPVAIKKGFVEEDKFGREKLIYPKLSFTRLAIRDNDSFFDQVFQLYNKGSVSIDVILDILNIDPDSTKKKIEADLFTVNDAAMQDLLRAAYGSIGAELMNKTDVMDKVSSSLGLTAVESGGEEEGGEDDLGGTPRFASRKLSAKQKKALDKMIKLAASNPDKLDEINKYLDKK